MQAREGTLRRHAAAGTWRRSAGTLALLAVVVTLLGAVSRGSAGQAQATPEIEDLLWDLQLAPLDGEPPRFTLPDLDGKSRSLSDVKGQVVLLYFWATW